MTNFEWLHTLDEYGMYDFIEETQFGVRPWADKHLGILEWLEDEREDERED